MFLTSGIKVYGSVQQDGKVIKSKTPFAIEVSITIIKIPTIEVEMTLIKIHFTVGVGQRINVHHTRQTHKTHTNNIEKNSSIDDFFFFFSNDIFCLK
jgi:hypothetical protein